MSRLLPVPVAGLRLDRAGPPLAHVKPKLGVPFWVVVIRTILTYGAPSWGTLILGKLPCLAIRWEFLRKPLKQDWGKYCVVASAAGVRQQRQKHTNHMKIPANGSGSTPYACNSFVESSCCELL